MKRLIPLLVIYVLIQQGAKTFKAAWTDGQPVDLMMRERMKNDSSITSFQVVDKQTFDAVSDQVHVDPKSDSDMKQAILDSKDTTKTTAQRLDALIKVVLP